MISAKIICDSIGKDSPRLSTFVLRYPKFIHGEFMTHRAFSRNASSSRAIPISKNLEEVQSWFRAAPVFWGAEQKGMQSGAELDCKEDAQEIWREAAWNASREAERLQKLGAHKSIVNRLLEPFLHINVVMTSCAPGLLNFSGLRLDKAAQPEIRALAEEIWKEWNEGKPELRIPDSWHLPFADASDTCNEISAANRYLGRDNSEEFDEKAILQERIKVSVARCARVSYTSHETGKQSTIEEDLALFTRLVGSTPLHASPAEHQATPDVYSYEKEYWQNPNQHGNLPGWIQYRKLLPDEAVAPLPEGYSL